MKNIKNGMLTPVSKTLRKNMTKEERHLWYDFLKKLPMSFKRQKVIGSYIVDFYCAEARLVIELDGSQHYTAAGQEADFVRDNFLQQHGLTVLRYSNRDIAEHFEGVCAEISRYFASVKPESSLP